MFNCEICGKVYDYPPHISKRVVYCDSCAKLRKYLSVNIGIAMKSNRKIGRKTIEKYIRQIEYLKYEKTKLGKKFFTRILKNDL